MANRTLTQATALAGVDIASNDELWIWDVTAAALRKCTRADLIGGVITGGGTVATGGFTLTVPATGTAALRGTSQTFSAPQTFSSVVDVQKLTFSGRVEFDSPAAGLFTQIATGVDVAAGGNITFARGIGGLLIIGSTSAARTSMYAINQQTGINVIYEDTLGFSRTAASSNKINITVSDTNIVVDNGWSTTRNVGIIYMRI